MPSSLAMKYSNGSKIPEKDYWGIRKTRKKDKKAKIALKTALRPKIDNFQDAFYYG